MLIELERQMILLEQQFLLNVSKEVPSLLTLGKEYLQAIAPFSVEERTALLAEVSEKILQFKEREELQAEWMDLKGAIQNEHHLEVTDSMLAIFDNHLDQWLAYKK